MNRNEIVKHVGCIVRMDWGVSGGRDTAWLKGVELVNKGGKVRTMARVSSLPIGGYTPRESLEEARYVKCVLFEERFTKVETAVKYANELRAWNKALVEAEREAERIKREDYELECNALLDALKHYGVGEERVTTRRWAETVELPVADLLRIVRMLNDYQSGLLHASI